MAKFYYIVANGPATLNVAGKLFSLNPGDAQGPFSEDELKQIQSSVDRSRIHIVPTELKTAPVVEPSKVKDPVEEGVAKVATPVEGYTPISQITSPSVIPNIFTENAQESINLTPDNTPKVELQVKQEAVPLPVTPNSPSGVIPTSSTEEVNPVKSQASIKVEEVVAPVNQAQPPVVTPVTPPVTPPAVTPVGSASVVETSSTIGTASVVVEETVETKAKKAK